MIAENETADRLISGDPADRYGGSDPSLIKVVTTNSLINNTYSALSLKLFIIHLPTAWCRFKDAHKQINLTDVDRVISLKQPVATRLIS